MQQMGLPKWNVVERPGEVRLLSDCVCGYERSGNVTKGKKAI
jgi:hypothetical protein